MLLLISMSQLLLPATVNILSIYSFSNIHDVVSMTYSQNWHLQRLTDVT